jgi:Glycosyl transferases group 1
MKVHVLGVPHTVTNKNFATCAFTQKALKLCAMMHRAGHEVVHYGAEGSDVECGENVVLASEQEFEQAYGHPGAEFYAHDKMTPARAFYLTNWGRRLGREIRARSGAPMTEVVAMTWGGEQRTACEGLAQFQVESGIGYPWSWADFRVYESYAWLHMHLGRDGGFGGDKWYWAVIPNAFDVDDFTFTGLERRAGPLLYLGRIQEDKGVRLAVEAAKAVGKEIVLVGQGNPAPFLEGNPHARHERPAGVERRAQLFAEASATLCLSRYVEPFCGVAVEAMLSGCPVVTTDWGAFAETVLHGETGWRVRTFEQLVWALRNIGQIDPVRCAQWASQNYSLPRVARQYEEYFRMVLDVGDPRGFYRPREERTELVWLAKYRPRA